MFTVVLKIISLRRKTVLGKLKNQFMILSGGNVLVLKWVVGYRTISLLLILFNFNAENIVCIYE